MSGAAPWAGLRASVFAATTVLLGFAAHLAGQGTMPPPATLLAAFVVARAGAGPIARRERSLPALLAGVGFAQVAMHVLFLGHCDTSLAATRGGLPMTGAHALAAVLLACWLRLGERRIWALARGFVARLRPPAPLVAVPWRAVVVLVPHRLRGQLVAAGPCVRGPPATRLVPTLS
jgi:hypothetical protein